MAVIFLFVQESQELKKFVDYYYKKGINNVQNPNSTQCAQIGFLRGLADEIDQTKLGFEDQIDLELFKLALDKKLAKYRLEKGYGSLVEKLLPLDALDQLALLSNDLETVLKKIEKKLTLGASYLRSDEARDAQKHLLKLLSKKELWRLHEKIEDFIKQIDHTWKIDKPRWLPSKMDRYNYTLKYELFIDLKHEELLEVAQENFHKTLVLMSSLASLIDNNKSWIDLVDETKKAPWTAEGYHDGALKLALEARDFAIAKDFVTVPQAVRGIKVTKGTSEAFPFGFYNGAYVTANVDKSRKDLDQVLRDNNKYWTKIVALHELVPGHHLQSLVTNSTKRSKIRHEFYSSVYIEGWGLYTEDLMHMYGYFDKDPLEKITLLRLRLWRCTRIVSDLGLQLGVLKDDDVIGMLVDCVRMEPVSAKAELGLYKQRPGYFCGYLIGWLNFLQIRSECEKILGPKFSAKAFHDKLISIGPLPIDLVRKIMLRWAEFAK